MGNCGFFHKRLLEKTYGIGVCVKLFGERLKKVTFSLD